MKSQDLTHASVYATLYTLAWWFVVGEPDWWLWLSGFLALLIVRAVWAGVHQWRARKSGRSA